jgi:hypothetical protein
MAASVQLHITTVSKTGAPPARISGLGPAHLARAPGPVGVPTSQGLSVVRLRLGPPGACYLINDRSHGHVRGQGSGLEVHGQFSGSWFGSKV